MKRAVPLFLIMITIALLAACGQSNQPSENHEKNTPSKETSAADNTKKARIYFDRTNEDKVSYKDHISALWEQTKPLLREDISKDFSDEEYKKLGVEIDAAWVNLQIHSSLHHMEEINNIKDARYANIMEDIIQLVDELYGNRDSGSKEAREKRRSNLKKSRLEFKIKEFDETLQKNN